MGPMCRGAAAPRRFAISSLLVASALCAVESGIPKDKMEDDHTPSVERLRKRIADFSYNSTNGVVMFAGPKESSYSQLSVPIWEAYCRRHGIDFFLQKEDLNSDYRSEWSKPRMLLEMLGKAKWKYIFMVEANSLPAKLGRHWEYAIKEHLRHKRHASDRTGGRLVFCPWDCDAEYRNPVEDGACHGPQITGCIYAAKDKKTRTVVRTWYQKRTEYAFEDQQALVQAFEQTRKLNYDAVYFKDVQKDMGRPGSAFLAHFTYGEAHGWNIREQIHDFILKHPDLGAAANQASKDKTKSEL